LLRADIEAAVPDFVQSQRWKRRDFAVNQRGQVFLSEGLARVAAQRLWLPAAAVDDAAAWLMRRLGQHQA
jgi:CRISPR-associated protein Cas1